MTDTEIRVRMAPAPTGRLHVGTALTTLLSGVAYVWQWGRRAWRAGENNEHVTR